MFRRLLFVAALAAFAVSGLIQRESLAGEKKKTKEVFTDPTDSSLPADFKIQGEYASILDDGIKHGCQIISLGKGAFQAVVYPGGLPGAGWDGKNKSLMEGVLDGDGATFKPASGKRRYLAGDPLEFSATQKFPPVGQKDYSAKVKGDMLSLDAGNGVSFALKKIVRTSPTLGAKAPEGAVILFDGTNTDEWQGGRLDKTTGLLNTDGSDIKSKKKFNDYTVHAEFFIPYRPDARGQGRGNSGFYQVLHYEVQILDSFGLEGEHNECGGVYERAKSLVNMCLPPLQWQTYDIDFKNAVTDGDKKVPAEITVRLNGVVIHDKTQIKSRTGGSRSEPEGTPGPFLLQGHGNPLQFKNIWVVEKK